MVLIYCINDIVPTVNKLTKIFLSMYQFINDYINDITNRINECNTVAFRSLIENSWKPRFPRPKHITDAQLL